MTAIVALAFDYGVMFYSDGAGTNPADGTLMAHADKIIVLPHLGAALAYRGSEYLSVAVHIAIDGRFTGFDELVDAIEDKGEQIAELQYQAAGMVNFEIAVGGWSAGRQAWELWWIGANGEDPDTLGEHALKKHPLSGLFHTPPLEAEQVEAILAPYGTEWKIDEIMMTTIEAQRRHAAPLGATADSPMGHNVGVFVQRTLLTHEGISTSIVRRWPDRIGEKITPADDMGAVDPSSSSNLT